MRWYVLSLMTLSSLTQAKAKLCYQVGTFVFESKYIESLSVEQAEAIVARAVRWEASSAKDYPKLPEGVGRRLPESPETYMRNQVKEALLSQDLVFALKTLQIIRPSTPRELIDRWRKDHPLTAGILESTAWNAFSLYFFGTLIHVPRLQTLRAQLRRQEVLDRIRIEGFDSVYPELHEKFGANARFDLAYQAARTAYYRFLVVHLVRMMWIYQDELKLSLDPRTWIFFRTFANATNEDLEKKQDETFEENKVRREQFESFREAYVDDLGPFDEPPPGPWEKDYEERVGRFPASYREEADRTWKGLVETPAEKLKATWAPKPN